MQTYNYKGSKKPDNIKLICPKCSSKNVHLATEKVNQYYSREDTYVRDNRYVCLDCLYIDFWNYFNQLLQTD